MSKKQKTKASCKKIFTKGYQFCDHASGHAQKPTHTEKHAHTHVNGNIHTHEKTWQIFGRIENNSSSS